MTFKKGDFIEMDYTGMLAETGEVFDTTKADVPHEHHAGHTHKPIIVCLGEGHVLKGIDNFLMEKSEGTYTVDIKPEDGFGKRKGELIQLIPTKKFTEQKVRPIPGGRVNVDGAVGTIRTVSGGRTIVDFNHPLAGKELKYTIEVKRKVTEPKEQVEAVLSLAMGIPVTDVTVKDKKAEVKLPFALPETMTGPLAENVKKLVGVELSFTEEKKEEKKQPAKEE